MDDDGDTGNVVAFVLIIFILVCGFVFGSEVTKSKMEKENFDCEELGNTYKIKELPERCLSIKKS